MKKIILTFLLLTSFLTVNADSTEILQENQEEYIEAINESLWINTEESQIKNWTYFVVSRYYSPLPDQKYYLKWNYEDEIILNWKWIRWASWKEVFMWMIARPKTYTFWTKIFLEWLGIWDVQDRWWAIVRANWYNSRWYAYDRIDVWMWSGDEWLLRALSWGKRTISWDFKDINEIANLDFSQIDINPLAIKYLESINQTQNEFVLLEKNAWINESLLLAFDTYITPETKDQNKIKRIQNLFKILGYYYLDINWNYDDIKDTIINYQLKIQTIKSNQDDWAWYFWPKTRSKIKEEYKKYLKNINIKNITNTNILNTTLEKKLSIWEKLKINIDKLISSIPSPNENEKSKNVKNIQIILKAIWYKNSKNWLFDQETKNILIKYQIDKKVLSSTNDYWAWSFWPKTKNAFKEDLEKLLIDYLKKINPWINIWLNY